MTEDPVPPSVCRPDLAITPEMDALVAKALEKSRDNRLPRTWESFWKRCRPAAGPTRHRANSLLQVSRMKMGGAHAKAALRLAKPAERVSIPSWCARLGGSGRIRAWRPAGPEPAQPEACPGHRGRGTGCGGRRVACFVPWQGSGSVAAVENRVNPGADSGPTPVLVPPPVPAPTPAPDSGPRRSRGTASRCADHPIAGCCNLLLRRQPSRQRPSPHEIAAPARPGHASARPRPRLGHFASVGPGSKAQVRPSPPRRPSRPRPGRRPT